MGTESGTSSGGGTMRLLITAGPTREPIDDVRFIGNRSSGRLGVALADEAARRGEPVTLLLGPGCVRPTEAGVRTEFFETSNELRGLLLHELANADVLVMAAAVADFRPAARFGGRKMRRGDAVSIELEPVPDLLAEASGNRRAGQLLVGFALEPREELLESARGKLERKKIDLIVANPLETMDGESVEAVVLGRDGFERRTDGAIPKTAFAPFLLDLITEVRRARSA